MAHYAPLMRPTCWLLWRRGGADGNGPGGSLVPAHRLEQARPPGGLALLAGGFAGLNAAFPRAFAQHVLPHANCPADFVPFTKSHPGRSIAADCAISKSSNNACRPCVFRAMKTTLNHTLR